jgi:two-component system C4-dicarboxylate transport sensor histidine kinase DctB
MKNRYKIFNTLEIKFIFIYLILATIIFLFTQKLISNNTNLLLSNKTQTYYLAYKTVYEQYKELSTVVGSGLVEAANLEKQLTNISKKSTTEQALIRDTIYKTTLKRFTQLETKHITSINYILPDGVMFLNMKSPKEYGNKISNQRATLRLAIKIQSAFDSFEVGKNGAGFRFTYPIFDEQKQFVGLVSLTFNPAAITSAIMKQYDVLSNFFIKQEKFDIAFLAKSTQYKNSHHKGYLYDASVLNKLEKTTNKTMTKLIPNKDITDAIWNHVTKYTTPLSIYDDLNKKIFTIIPIINKANNEEEAFLSIRSSGDELSAMHKNYYLIMLLVLFVLLMLLFVIYIVIIKNAKDKLLVEENAKKEQLALEQAKLVSMGEMIGNIAHQWRQPLSVISTSATGMLMQKEYGLLTDEKFSESCETINKNAQYLSKTIDDFRNFIKGDREKTTFNLKDIMHSFLNLVNGAIKTNYINIILELQDDIKLDGYPNELTQCLINIFNNAKDALKDKNEEDRAIFISTIIKDDKAVITIKDNAGGIPQNVLPRIFEPYFTTKHQSQGTGLGLSMSNKLIVDGMGGTIVATNEEFEYNGKTYLGAEFTITLPYN